MLNLFLGLAIIGAFFGFFLVGVETGRYFAYRTCATKARTNRLSASLDWDGFAEWCIDQWRYGNAVAESMRLPPPPGSGHV